MVVSVLRLGHRVYRDMRITTHCCLVARAFGADSTFIEGDMDKNIIKSINRVSDNWGGSFRVEFISDWKKMLKDWDGEVIHLTQYGMPFEESLDELKKSNKNKLIVVGGKKVPPDLYGLTTHNISIYNQPHSEISALAICLDCLVGKVPSERFENAKLKIIPQKSGKNVIKNEKS